MISLTIDGIQPDLFCWVFYVDVWERSMNMCTDFLPCLCTSKYSDDRDLWWVF